MLSLRAERDKMALEANFARERLDSFMKEFEHQVIRSCEQFSKKKKEDEIIRIFVISLYCDFYVYLIKQFRIAILTCS